MARELVDIIVIGRNEERFLARCLESAREASERLEQECQVHSQIVYVDSHSTDRSVEIAERARVSVRFAPRQFRTPPNGRMAGFLQTHGDYIMFMDGDMELHPDFLVEAMKFMQEHSEAAGLRGIWDDLQYRGEKPVLISNFDKVPSAVTSKNAYFAGALFARRKAIEQVGGYEVCLLINEEVALYCKLRQANWLTYRLPIPMITHFNAKISSVRGAITHKLVGRKTLMSGVLIRYSVMNTQWWPQLLRYHLAKIVHGGFLLFVGILAVLTYHVDRWRFALCVGIVSVLALYVLLLVQEKRGVIRGLAAIVLRTIYITNICVGFLFYFPKLSFGFQCSEEYRKMVCSENR